MPELNQVKSDYNHKHGTLRWLWITVFVVIADLYTKSLATQLLEFAQPVKIFPFFNFTLLHNTGAAFSFLSDAGGWQRWFFTAIASVTVIILLVWMWRIPKTDRWVAISLALIMGGAIGNVYDRITLGYVVDFLHFHWKDAYFPAFNIADSAITVGAIMMGIDVLFFEDSKVSDDENSDEGCSDNKKSNENKDREKNV